MLLICKSLAELQFSQLMEVYLESNQMNGSEFCPEESMGQQLLHAEHDFFQYLNECFFRTKDAVYCIWVEDGTYVSALRLEPYEDGFLLAALETAPSFRRRGYAAALVRETLTMLTCRGPVRVYSHVAKRNTPSLGVHLVCGFRKILDYAVYVDGSVMNNHVTLIFEQ